MKMKKFAVFFAAALMLFSCGCGETGTQNGGDGGDGEHMENTFFKDYANLPELRLGSYYSAEEEGVRLAKLRVPFTDTFSFSFSPNLVARVELFDETGNPLADKTEDFKIRLKEGDLVCARFTTKNGLIRVNVTPNAHSQLMPFEVNAAPDPSRFATHSDPAADPMKPAEIEYVKRKGTLYVYCNAPEGLWEGAHVINHCITRQDISDQSVFFTMEQQSDRISPSVYYGYRVRNTGTEDVYVSVRNIGYQRMGAGSYLGEQEWTHFYNTNFKIPNFSDFTESQMANWKAYFDFAGNYQLSMFKPTVYRIPAGRFMYVFGGTKEDAFGRYDVGDTADHPVNGGCQNGAVLFEVIGKAEGAYYVYDDPAKVAPGTEGGDDHLGITDPEAYGVVHTGEDVGYVVDNEATWTFNDMTPAGKLPVTFENYYMDEVPESGEPGERIPSTPHRQTLEEWVTHINVQTAHEAVGTDMTSFHTLFNKKKGDGVQLPITVGCEWYDSRGKLANIGNWMKDYQDVFTFVNQGDGDREVIVNLNCTGALCTLVRNVDGSVVKDSEYFAFQRGSDQFGEGYDKAFHYKAKIPAHTVVQFVVEYNLMANSTGYVRHSVELL